MWRPRPRKRSRPIRILPDCSLGSRNVYHASGVVVALPEFDVNVRELFFGVVRVAEETTCSPAFVGLVDGEETVAVTFGVVGFEEGGVGFIGEDGGEFPG